MFANGSSGVVGMADGKPPWIGTKTFAGFEHFLATDDPAVHTETSSSINTGGAEYVFAVFEFDFVEIL